MDTTSKFVAAVLNALPEEGLKKLSRMIDEDQVSVSAIQNLLQEYQIDPVAIANTVKGV